MLHRLIPLALALGAVAAVGCDDSTNCTLQLVPSIELTVVDAETGEHVDAMVSFQLDGAEPRNADQYSLGQYSLGDDEDGSFQVTVSASGYETAMATYEVAMADGCHVTTVEDTIELTAAP